MMKILERNDKTLYDTYVDKYYELVEQGYSEGKAFNKVYRSMRNELEYHEKIIRML